ncbi:MAG TPA: hypothetical protein VME66_07540 [Candidatus Acidoferrales bacterium]|nr:hypothetical protein [Candidatus Acidoferrales bacterium]
MKVCIEPMGAAPLIAEYDAQQQTIRVNARIVERVRVRYGESAAQDLVRCAIAHESYHTQHPDASEAAAHAFARAQARCEPRILEELAR